MKPSVLWNKSPRGNTRTQGKEGEITEQITCELLEFGKEVEGIKTITEKTDFEETQRRRETGDNMVT